MSEQVSVKGIRDGLLVTLRDEGIAAQSAALLAFIDARQKFFSGARLALDVGTQAWKVKDLSALREALSERGLYLWAVLSESQVTTKTAQLLGLATRLSARQAPPRRQSDEKPAPGGRWVARTVRSGVRVESDGHLTVLGDVNPGGEVIAVGSILIWGRLRGSAHAGVQGDKSACVCALEMSPQRLQIADGQPLAGGMRGIKEPSMARLESGSLIVLPWRKREQ